MHTVTDGDILYEMSNPAFLGKIRKNITYLLSAELTQRVVKVRIINSILAALVMCVSHLMTYMAILVKHISNSRTYKTLPAAFIKSQ